MERVSTQPGPIAEVVGLKGAPYTFVSFRGHLRSIEPLIAIVLGCMRWKSAQVHEVRR
jgi:hypothetical protein